MLPGERTEIFWNPCVPRGGSDTFTLTHTRVRFAGLDATRRPLLSYATRVNALSRKRTHT
jgi:hypothetical protein